jgi:ferric-dicitrate binding protein FerR (iron transport regulator)
MPGGSKAVLTLADGRKIELDSSQPGKLAQEGDVSVVNHQTSVLSYNTGNGQGPVVYNTLSTPRGGQYQLQLADGTKVWLNASSTISYPVEFREPERTVTISGEAYFEVAKNTAKPFKVITKKGTIEVLGTHFNVMAYDDEKTMNTTLLEGSVKVRSGSAHTLMSPGWQTQVPEIGHVHMEQVAVEDVMAWKNGQFNFSSNDVPTIMRQVARWYDVDVTYKGKIPDGHFSGIVNRDMKIDTVLKIMQEGGIRFNIEGHKIIVGKGGH